MTQEELDLLLAELRETLSGLGIPLGGNICPRVQVNTRAKQRLGCCFHVPAGQNHRGAVDLSTLPFPQKPYDVIEVSAQILEDHEKVRQTLCHELLHTCPGCRNHGDMWKAYAAKVNEALGTDIRRLSPSEGESGVPRPVKINYILKCRSCGKLFCRSRKSKLVKYPWRYRCQCGGKLDRVQ